MTTTAPAERRSYATGILMLFGAAVLWSLSGALIKSINERGTGPNGITIAFYRSLFAGLALVPLARGRFHTLRAGTPGGASRNGHPSERARRIPRPAFRARWPTVAIRPEALACLLFFTVMTACFVVANTKTEAANAILLQYTSTFWVFLLSPAVIGERPHRRDFNVLALAMLGILVIFAGNASGDLMALVAALAAGLFFGLLTLMIRLMRDANSAAVAAWNNLGSALLLLPVAAMLGNLLVSTRALVLLVILGVVQFGLPYYLYTVGLTRVPAHHAAVVTMAEPLLVPVWTYLAVREEVPGTTVIGGAMILVALVCFVRGATRARVVKNAVG